MNDATWRGAPWVVQQWHTSMSAHGATMWTVQQSGRCNEMVGATPVDGATMQHSLSTDHGEQLEINLTRRFKSTEANEGR